MIFNFYFSTSNQSKGRNKKKSLQILEQTQKTLSYDDKHLFINDIRNQTAGRVINSCEIIMQSSIMYIY